MDFYYKKGNIETTKPWITPPPLDNVNAWWKDFRKNDLEDYSVWIGGKYAIDKDNTNDVDIILTGPVYDYMRLFNLLKDATDLGLNKHNIFIDICWYDNINFFKYPKTPNFIRQHLRIKMSGEEIKKMNGKEIFRKNTISTLQHESYPKELAINMVNFPMEKQIKDGRTYNPILLNPKK